MDLDLVLEITPEELEEFPEVTETDLVTGVKEEGIIVPDCSQHSLQTSKDHTEDTPQKEEVHTQDTTLTTHPIGRDTPNRRTKDKGTPKTITREPTVYKTRSHVRPRRRKNWRWEEGQDRPQIPPHRCNTTPAQNMDVMHELVRQMSRLKTKGTGGGGGGDSDPESSDSFNEDGTPKMRGPLYYERQKRKTRRAIKRINPPVFKGEPGERPEAHLLRTLDWYDAIGVHTDRAKLKNFRHTLDSSAREWFADIWSKRTPDFNWDKLMNDFSRYFSTQGRSLTHLHNAWKSFIFDPESMDIEDFIRDVQECGTQLRYDECSIMDMIKSCMPRENYGTLYKMDTLTEVITFCKDAYAVTPAERAKKASQASASGPGANPFTSIKTKSTPTLADNLIKLTETLNKIDFKQKPYKPQIYPRGRGQGRGRSQPGGRNIGQGQQGQRSGFQPRGGFRGKGHGGRFDRSPTKRNPRVNSKTKDADKDRCRYCREIGHWVRDCPQKKKDENKGEEPKPYGAFSGLSDALPEFYGQTPLAMGNPAIGEMFQGITEVQQDDNTPEQPQEPEYLN